MLKKDLSGIIAILLATAGFSWLLAMRISKFIFDGGCPTYALNMIRQLMNQGFPASFPGTPGITANYHQGTFYLSAVLADIFSLGPQKALALVLLIFSAATVLLLLLYCRKRAGLFYALAICAGAFFSASLPGPQTWPLNDKGTGPYDYISLFEYLASNSWPIALFLATIQFVSLRKARTIKGFILFQILPLLFLPLFNPTVFIVSWLATGILLVWSATHDFRESPEIKWLVPALGMIAAIMLPRAIPSAMMTGDAYEQVLFGVRLLTENRSLVIGDYLFLHPLLSYLTLFFILRLVRIDISGEHAFIVAFFVISFCFPLVVSFNNVAIWDNIHKFVLLTSFASVFVLTAAASPQPAAPARTVPARLFGVAEPAVMAAIAVSLAASVPAQYSHFSTRSQSRLAFSLPAHPDDAFFRFLNAENRSGNIMLWYYGSKDFCGAFTDVLKYTNVYLAGAYYDTFLLAPRIEAISAADRDWTAHDPLALQRQHPSGLKHYYYSRIEDWERLEELLRGRGLRLTLTGQFGRYRIGTLSAKPAVTLSETDQR